MAYSLTVPSVSVRACPCPFISRSDRTSQGTHIAMPLKSDATRQAAESKRGQIVLATQTMKCQYRR